MFDLSLAEVVIIAVVALIVIRPEDLPVIMRSIGKFFKKMKKMGREFTEMFDDISSDVGDIKQGVKEIIDLDGNVQKTYDISDIAEFTDKGKKGDDD